jgi:uncharacterized protein YjbI with pentapeptide repeats
MPLIKQSGGCITHLFSSFLVWLETMRILSQSAIALFALLLLLPFATPAYAQATKYYNPPLSYSNAELTGQDFSGQTLQGAEFSNANLEFTDFSNADVRGTVFSASVMTKANLSGADLTYALVDQVDFTGADLTNAILVESILLRSTFDNVEVTGADFTDAILDGKQIQILCETATGTNPETGVVTRDSLGCDY